MRGVLGIRCRKAEGMKAVIANTHLGSAYDDLYRGAPAEVRSPQARLFCRVL